MSDIAALVSDNLDIWTGAIERKSGAGRGGGSKRISLYGIERLRALVLDLAVRGKLVPQDTGDEPAGELLKRIDQSRLTQFPKLKKSIQPTACGETQVTPKGWEVVRLDRVANSQAGFAFKSKGFNEIGAGLPLIRIRDVGQPFTGTFYEGDFRDEFLVVAGDYLISMDGEFRVAEWPGPDALLNQRVSRLQFFGNHCVQSFVAIALQLELTKLQGVKAYTTVDHLSGKQISASPIPLPPLAEQRRIVAKVDELMALCDALERESADALAAHQTLVDSLLATLVNSADAADLAANWARLQSHFDTLFTTEASIDALKQTILDLAVRGKLVSQNMDDEPALELERRLVKERKEVISERKIRGAKAPPSPDAAKEGLILPPAWRLPALGQITLVTDPNPSHRYPDYRNGTVPILSTREFDGLDGWNPTTAKLTTHEFWEFQKKICAFDNGDIIFARKGRLGLPRFLPDIEKFTFSHTLFVIKPMQGVHPQYLLWLLRRNEVIDWLTAEMNRNVGVPTLGKAKMERLPIPLPPLAEQQRIVAKVDKLMALCDALKAKLSDAAETRRHLADAIVERAAA